mmetsp:Transcript_22885/g.3766  ORF Transcript_22885/g.3766 Transcript_22885/m.3766 type:complete len:131 (-) Transcript_22885:20-412(-)
MSEQGYGDDFLERIVRPKIKQIMLHLMRMTGHKLLKHPRVFEIFGLDFLLDEDFNIWFIELNLTPAIGDTNDEKKEVNTKFLNDVMDMQYKRLYGNNIDDILEKSDFEIVYDGREEGIERYAGLLSEECV